MQDNLLSMPGKFGTQVEPGGHDFLSALPSPTHRRLKSAEKDNGKKNKFEDLSLVVDTEKEKERNKKKMEELRASDSKSWEYPFTLFR